MLTFEIESAILTNYYPNAGERLKGRATSSLQAQQTLPTSVSFARKVPSKASICAGNMVC